MKHALDILGYIAGAAATVAVIYVGLRIKRWL